ncbi:MAG: ABC transporter permease subunit [Clostridia bacterium]
MQTVSKKEKKNKLTSKSKLNNNVRFIRQNWDLYLMLLIPVAYLIIFKYIPMYGVQIAFRNYSVFKGITGSDFVGFTHFITFFKSSEFTKLLGNTLRLSLYSLIAGMFFPIILALILNYINNVKVRKVIQTITVAPYFISTTVMVSIILQFLAMNYGPVNQVLSALGLSQINFFGSTAFPHVYVWSGVWQTTGYSAIIYIAALAGIDPTLHEAAVVDGASKFKRIWHIDLPSIKPTFIILTILACGHILSTGFEKIYLLQNTTNTMVSEVIDTYVYKIGIAATITNYSYPTAIGLFQSIIGLILILTVNTVANKVGESGLW